MITATVLVVFAVLALLLLVIVARGRAAAVNDISGLAEKASPVDIAAFRNLIDSGEEEYLRRELPPADFRRIHRERLLVAVEYLRAVAQNAAVLLRLGEAARRSADPEVAAAGQELVNNALTLRLYVLMAGARFYAGIVFPGMRLPQGRIASTYEDLTNTVSRLGRLQQSRLAGAA